MMINSSISIYIHLRMCFSSLIIIHFFLILANAKRGSHCDPSACGIIRNISYPFRLTDDPPHCGDPDYELVCENNTTLIYFDSHNYRVQAISYDNYTIRLADAAMNNDTCLLPRYSQNEEPLRYSYPYSLQSYDGSGPLAQHVNFLSCPYPVNYSFYVKYDHCVDRGNALNASLTSSTENKYIKFGTLNASKVGDMCKIDLVVLTSIPFKHHKNVSVLEIHHSLLYGFEISWYAVFCGDTCGREGYCRFTSTDRNRGLCGNLNWDHCIYRQQQGCGGILDPIIKFLLAILVLIPDGIRLFIVAKYVIGVTFLLGLVIYKLRTRHSSMFDEIEGFLQSHNNLSPIRYSYSEIKKITRGFREKLGQGGYGSVYKGKLRSGHDAAIKVLSSKSSSKGQDFMNEVATIGRIHHVNVVKLVGYCAERSRRALVYDFMPNGSLEKYIFSQETTSSLNWEKKYDIAVGVARGIEYLHRGCEIQILHFDIKPHNILLDEHFTPKISDFGLAKFYSTGNNTVSLTAARGTIGYVAPELINRSIGGVSHKADVYSFGMLLMETVGLKKDLIENPDNSSEYFPYWIYNHLDKWKDIEMGKLKDIVDDDDDGDAKLARKMAIVALWCIQMSPGNRPSMSKVLEMLEGEVEFLQIPPKPCYSGQVGAFVEDDSWSSEITTDSTALLCGDNSRAEFTQVH